MSHVPEKSVKVAELKAKLSAYLRAARRGQSVTVCDRDTPVARLVPCATTSEVLVVRKATKPLRDVIFPSPPRRRRKVDSLAALLAEREPLR